MNVNLNSNQKKINDIIELNLYTTKSYDEMLINIEMIMESNQKK
jgi:hypothetical protein